MTTERVLFAKLWKQKGAKGSLEFRTQRGVQSNAEVPQQATRAVD